MLKNQTFLIRPGFSLRSVKYGKPSDKHLKKIYTSLRKNLRESTATLKLDLRRKVVGNMIALALSHSLSQRK